MIDDPLIQPNGYEPFSPVPSAPPGWMITFADLLSLLLSFFVLMFATTTIDHADWTRVMRPVTVYFGGHPAPSVPGLTNPDPPPAAGTDINYLGAALRQLVAQDPNLAGAQITLLDHGAILSLPPGLVPCRTRTVAPRRFVGLATLLGNIDNRIVVTGHSGIDPTRTAGSADWGRALDVANAVADQLKHAGASDAIGRSGQADLPGGEDACAADVTFGDETAARNGGSGGN